MDLLGWQQLWKQKPRFAIALGGVALAVVLMLMQLGFRDSLFESSVRFYRSLRFEIALVSPDTSFVVRPHRFSQRRLYQALGVAGVTEVSPVYLALGQLQNPRARTVREIFVAGVDPAKASVATPGADAGRELIKLSDVVLFDRASRAEFGPIAQTVAARGSLVTELNGRSVDVRGLFELGTSFGIDGNVLTSVPNFLRIFPERAAGLIDLGLVRVAGSADVRGVRDTIRAALPGDVLVLSRDELLEREKDYWDRSTPIGYVFAFGVAVGLVVGGIIVYQILFADVSDHLAEYATLKAIGQSDAFLTGVVLQQAAIVALLGYGLGLPASLWLYAVAGEATQLPLGMTVVRALVVFALTFGMCCGAALLAMRRVRRLDPAEVFG